MIREGRKGGTLVGSEGRGREREEGVALVGGEGQRLGGQEKVAETRYFFFLF